MAWEFRKLGPGENVAVETQKDPFAAPRWAPPVWHMPEGLVLLVNLGLHWSALDLDAGTIG